MSFGGADDYSFVPSSYTDPTQQPIFLGATSSEPAASAATDISNQAGLQWAPGFTAAGGQMAPGTSELPATAAAKKDWFQRVAEGVAKLGQDASKQAQQTPALPRSAALGTMGAIPQSTFSRGGGSTLAQLLSVLQQRQNQI